MIEVWNELHENEETLAFFTRGDNASEWRVNGRVASCGIKRFSFLESRKIWKSTTITKNIEKMLPKEGKYNPNPY